MIVIPPPHLALLQPDKMEWDMLREEVPSANMQPPPLSAARAPLNVEPTTETVALSLMSSEPPAWQVLPENTAVSRATVAFLSTQTSPPYRAARFCLNVF